MASRKLALVSASFFPKEGGAERQLRQVLSSKSLAASYDCWVVTRGRPAFHIVDVQRAVTPASHGMKAFFYLETLKRLNDVRPDAVIASQVGVETGAASIYCALTKTPLAVRLSGGGVPVSGENRWVVRRVPQPVKMALRVAGDRVPMVLVSPSQRLMVDTIDRIGNGSWDTQIIPNGVSNRMTSTNYPPTVEQPAVVWYGRAADGKDPDSFLRLVHACPQLRFKVYGRIELPTIPNVSNMGWSDTVEDAIPGELAAVSTSRFEGSPNFLLQALACGLPVVAFDIPATRELREAYPGWVTLVPTGDIKELAAALGDLAGRAKERRPLPLVPTISEVSDAWKALIDSLILNC